MAVSFPAPIGGVPLKDDFAPSIVFASAFAILTAIGAFVSIYMHCSIGC